MPSDIEITWAPLSTAHWMAVHDAVAAPAVRTADHLADEAFFTPRRDADSSAVDVSAEDRARAVRSVAVPVAVAVAGEVLLAPS